MKLLDLFCGAGGCTAGYQRAGFWVRGVDIKPQPRYCGEEFAQADALEYLAGLIESGEIDGFDAIHASPPCQRYSAMTGCRPGNANSHPDLVDETRQVLQSAGAAFVIENVPGAPLDSFSNLFGGHGAHLCGLMFGLDLYRHRIFETSFPVSQPKHPRHTIPASKAGHWKPGTIISVCGNCAPIALARKVMGIDWMAQSELSQAIPPAYTEFIGRQLMVALKH